MTQTISSFWCSGPFEVAGQLIDKRIRIGGKEAIIEGVQPFKRSENTAPGYTELLGMLPGQVFCPWRMAILFLIATHDEGRPGGCVKIQQVSFGGKTYKGPKQIALLFDITKPGVRGTTHWIDESTFEVLWT